MLKVWYMVVMLGPTPDAAIQLGPFESQQQCLDNEKKVVELRSYVKSHCYPGVVPGILT